MRTVILVPYRSQPERVDSATYTFNHLLTYGWPIHTGDSDGEWNRAEALNRAAADAGAWDIAVVADADTIHEPRIVERAVVSVSGHGGAVIPWNYRYKLNQAGTARLMAEGLKGFHTRFRDTDRLDPTPSRLGALHRGGTIVVSREAWEAVNGFDEEFRFGWGHEDLAFRVSIRALSRLREHGGTIWHLWHPRDGKAPPEHESRKAVYMEAQYDKDRIRELRGISA